MIGEQPQGAILRLGKVVKVHPSDHSVDLVMMDNGAKLANVQVLSPTASTRSGRVDLPEPDIEDQSKPWSLKMSKKQDLLAAVAMMAGTPICIGFLYPQVNELAMVEDTKNLAIQRHASDFYHITTDEAVKTFCHPGGAYLSFGGNYFNLGHKDDQEKSKSTLFSENNESDNNEIQRSESAEPYPEDNNLNLKIISALNNSSTHYEVVELHANHITERRAELSPMGEFSVSAYSRYTNELTLYTSPSDGLIQAYSIVFDNGTRIDYKYKTVCASFVYPMQEFIKKLIKTLPDVRLVNGVYRLFKDDEIQPPSTTTEWHGRTYGENYQVNVPFSNVDAFVGEPTNRPPLNVEDGKGGGFDKNWVIKRNVRPVTITLFSPDRFKKPKHSSDFTCAPTRAMLAARWLEDDSTGQQEMSSANVTVLSSGHINATAAGGNITANTNRTIKLAASEQINGDAGGNINLKGSAIFLN